MHVRLGMSSGVAACAEVAIGTGVAGLISFDPRGSSASLIEGGAPRDADGGSLLSVLY